MKQALERAELESQSQIGSPTTEAPPEQFVLRGSDRRQNAEPFVFDSWDARDAYYEARRLESERDYRISNEVRHHYFTRGEVRRGLIIRQSG